MHWPPLCLKTFRAVILTASVVCFGLYGHNAYSQASPPPQSTLSLLQVSQANLVGSSTAAQDIRLNGTVQYTAGSQNEAGTFAYLSRPDGTARTDITLPSGVHSELRFPQGSSNVSATSDLGASAQPIAAFNLFVAANWAFPEHILGLFTSSLRGAASSATANCVAPNICILSETGMNDTSVDPYVQQMSAMTISLDPNSFLPMRLDWSAHPNGQQNQSVLIDVQYSNYQTVNGHSLPFHIQQYVNGSLFLDVTLSTAAFDATVSASDLSL